MSPRTGRGSRRARLKSLHLRKLFAREQSQRLVSPAPRGRPITGLFDLPKEVRDLIYEECLVSDDTIALSNLQLRSRYHPRHQSLRLVSNILLACRQVYTEGSAVLYAANTFHVDLQPLWDYTRMGRFRYLLNKRVYTRDPYACMACSGLAHVKLAVTGRPHFKSHSARWNPRVHDVRRLHISLRPYSYSQYWSVGSLHSYLQRIAEKDDRALVHSCSHSLQHALPKLRHLDLLILHVGKPAIAVSEENMDLSAAIFYPFNANPWKICVQKDMDREILWLLSFAKQSANCIVIPESGSAQGLNDMHRGHVTRACSRPRRGVLEETQRVVDKVPDRFLRTGNLARIKRRHAPPELTTAELPWNVGTTHDEYRVEAANERIEGARESGVVPLLRCSQDLIHDSL